MRRIKENSGEDEPFIIAFITYKSSAKHPTQLDSTSVHIMRSKGLKLCNNA